MKRLVSQGRYWDGFGPSNHTRKNQKYSQRFSATLSLHPDMPLPKCPNIYMIHIA